MFADAFDKLHLLFKCETTKGYFVYRDEAVIIHVCKESHNKLAIHAVRNSTVPRNRVSKVLNLEGTFETRGKETTEWGNQGGERSKYEDMNLHGCHIEGLDVREPDWKVVEVRNEDGIRCTFKTRPNVRAQILLIVRTDS
jgi:hypothetical protein